LNDQTAAISAEIRLEDNNTLENEDDWEDEASVDNEDSPDEEEILDKQCNKCLNELTRADIIFSCQECQGFPQKDLSSEDFEVCKR